MFMAEARFLCCDRESCIITTIPVGIWVMRIADSVLLTCWPPAPCARMVSIFRSSCLMSTSTSSTSGSTATVAAHGALAGGDHFDLPTLQRGKAFIHPEQVAREQRRLVAAGAGADFQHHV